MVSPPPFGSSYLHTHAHAHYRPHINARKFLAGHNLALSQPWSQHCPMLATCVIAPHWTISSLALFNELSRWGHCRDFGVLQRFMRHVVDITKEMALSIFHKHLPCYHLLPRPSSSWEAACTWCVHYWCFSILYVELFQSSNIRHVYHICAQASDMCKPVLNAVNRRIWCLLDQISFVCLISRLRTDCRTTWLYEIYDILVGVEVN